MQTRAYSRRPGAKFLRKREETEQQQFVNWVKRKFPHVIIYTDFGAGLYLTDNERIRMVGMRSRDGMPDIYIDFPSRDYHGARFEFKKTGTPIYKKDGKTLRKDPYTRRFARNGREYIKRGDHLQEQALTLKEYVKHGYFARFAVGLEHAKKLFCWYMEVPEPTELDLPF